MPTKLNSRTIEQYERIGCGTFDNTDGVSPSIAFQVHWVQDDENGKAKFSAVSRTITIPFDPTNEVHAAVFSGLRTIGLEAISGEDDPVVIEE
jgi:hypothetical protein